MSNESDKNFPRKIYSIGVSSPITPTEPLPPLPAIPRGSLVIVEGRAPIWRYGMALHLLHGSPAAAVAFYDPKLGAVVVSSHSKTWSVGEVIDITLPAPGSISEKTQPPEERDR